MGSLVWEGFVVWALDLFAGYVEKNEVECRKMSGKVSTLVDLTEQVSFKVKLLKKIDRYKIYKPSLLMNSLQTTKYRF